jgi:hypothetical protein
MAKEMKVFAWQSFRQEAQNRGQHGSQTREICATVSKAELGRITGKRPAALFCLGVTANDIEVAAALANPHTVLWAPLDGPERRNYVPDLKPESV